MAEHEKNNWDHANQQGTNRDFNKDESEDMYLKDQKELNLNKDADGFGSESARSDHSQYRAGMAGRSGNNDEHEIHGSTRGDRNSSSNQGASGRSS